MIIVLTGADGSGKTTLFNKLKRYYNQATYIKESYPGQNLVARYARNDNFKTFVRFNKDVVVIYDRATIIDDLIYEPIINNKPSYFEKDVDSVALLLRQCHIIYLYGDPNVFKHRLNTRGDDHINSDQIERIQLLYEQLFQKMDLNPIMVDTTVLTPDQSFDKIIKTLEAL